MMDSLQKSEVFIDEQIPVEKQIDFLRNQFLNLDLTMYQTLCEKLGEDGENLYHSIKVRLMDKAMRGMANELKDIAAYPDRILGYRVEVDYDTPEEAQVILRNCPNFEKAKEYGLEKEICKIICDFEVEQVKARGYGELMILSKIAEGADKCTFKLKKIKK